jgi:hypothetical protein
VQDAVDPLLHRTAIVTVGATALEPSAMASPDRMPDGVGPDQVPAELHDHDFSPRSVLHTSPAVRAGNRLYPDPDRDKNPAIGTVLFLESFQNG